MATSKMKLMSSPSSGDAVDGRDAGDLVDVRPEPDSAKVRMYTIGAFLRRGRPDPTLKAGRVGNRPPKAACLAALHRVASNRRFQRSPGLSSSPKTVSASLRIT